MSSSSSLVPIIVEPLTPRNPRKRKRNRRKKTNAAVAVLTNPNRLTMNSEMVATSSSTESSNVGVRTRRRVKRRRLNPQQSGLLEQYRHTLLDPFQHGPVPLGFGTCVPTIMTTAYRRMLLSVNATDGSFSMFFIPANSVDGSANLRGGLYFNSAGNSATPVYTAYVPSNAAAVVSSGREARIVSAGIRVTPQIASTAKPGTLYSGTIPSEAYGNLNSAGTPDFFSSLPLTHWSTGTVGVQVNSQPCDLDSYSFWSSNAFGYGDNVLSFNSIPYVAGYGFPTGNSTTLLVEVVINSEYIPSLNSSSVSYSPQDANLSDSIMDYFPSVDQLTRYVRNILGSPVTMDFARNILEAQYMERYARNGAPIRAARQPRVLIEEVL